jgi:galactose mutarotase-like enzyme
MFEVQQVADPLETHILRDPSSGAEVTVAPERGGMVTRFRCAGREVLYLDPATLADRSKNVRGGIPVLFPIAGRLEGGAFTAGGAKYTMSQHGFARNLPFRVTGQQTQGRAAITLSLESSQATRAVFPWDFELRLTYALAGNTLSIEQATTCGPAGPMPLHAGFHPYFLLRDVEKARARISTDATQAFDNVTGETRPFTGFDLTKREVDLHLLDHRARTASLTVGKQPVVTLEMDGSFTTLVVWTLSGKDFVCVEPWTAPGDALNSGTHLIHVPAGATHRASFRLVAD